MITDNKTIKINKSRIYNDISSGKCQQLKIHDFASQRFFIFNFACSELGQAFCLKPGVLA